MDSTAEKIIQIHGCTHPQRSGVILADTSLCMTCRECEVACSLSHDGECNPSLSRIHIEYDDFVPRAPSIVVCKQCDWPACYFACAAKWGEPAIRIDADEYIRADEHIRPHSGARYIDPSLCRGCGACLKACPLTPERKEPAREEPAPEEQAPPVIGYKAVGRKRVYLKCDLCFTRPEGPACVQICPGNALTFVSAERRK
jgi:Fe-S-cluster-containing hydrogenase component 2